MPRSPAISTTSERRLLRFPLLAVLKTAFHGVAAAAALLFAYQTVLSKTLDWWLHDPAVGRILALAMIYGVIAILCELLFRVERSPWRLVSTRDAFALMRSTGAATLIFLAVVFIVDRAESLPRSVLLFGWILYLIGLAGVRLLRRAVHEGAVSTALKNAGMAGRRSGAESALLLVGTIEAADSALRDIERDPTRPFRPVGVITPTDDSRGKRVRSVPVLGTIEDWDLVVPAALPDSGKAAAVLFLDDPALYLGAEQLGALTSRGVRMLRLPRLSEIEDGGRFGVREVAIEELLSRPPVKLELSAVKALVAGRRVVITGAGGSIGSEICRQVAALGCAHLTMLDHSEALLFSIDHEIADSYPQLSRREVLCSIRDRQRLHQWFREERPDIVFHAAALKHVPLVEAHPDQGFLTNVIGTLNVTEAAAECGAGDMVMISTDKAVAPTNVMGATKRIAEAVVRQAHSDAGTRFTVVRFGNVLGSAGSVVPIFRDQIAQGGPLTVTHRDVERYFMTIPEAVQLVLHAAATRQLEGDHTAVGTYVLDMGSPVRIHDLAERMITLSGRVPHKDIQIEIVGLRPGEKLYEELVDETEEIVSRAAGVLTVADRLPSGVLSRDELAEIARIAERGDEAAARERVYAMVEQLRIGSHQAKGADA